ncbi:uncharacterized protein LOC130053432 [Ostrea edulis]|uniref:uncharacterized protein LOC130053432 n=1 Tax=Ostrea edulis TaxID=37623 RepID=UPI0024AEAC47|nr:uncharacterized protein LOC130053432 [Ostrea edulis]
MPCNNACCKASLKEKERELERVKKQLSKAQEELELHKSSQLVTGDWITQRDGHPRAGHVPKEIAENHNMMELMPGSGIYVYPKDIRVLSKKKVERVWLVI